MLEISVYIEPDEPKDEDFDVRSDVEPSVTLAAAVRVPLGASDADAVDQLVELWESSGDSRVPDAVFEREDFLQPEPDWTKKKPATKRKEGEDEAQAEKKLNLKLKKKPRAKKNSKRSN